MYYQTDYFMGKRWGRINFGETQPDVATASHINWESDEQHERPKTQWMECNICLTRGNSIVLV